MSKASSILTALAGAVTGGAVTWGVITYGGKPPPPPPQDHRMVEDPGQWLLEPGTTMKDIFKDGAMDILEEPDHVTLHELSDKPPGDEPDAIVHDGHAFHPAGAEAKLDPLLRTVRSISAYRGMSMCEFNPAVMLRITQDDRHLDLLFCFGCRDMLFFLDGKPCGGGGMSDDGYKSFLHYFRQILPENGKLKAARDLP